LTTFRSGTIYPATHLFFSVYPFFSLYPVESDLPPEWARWSRTFLYVHEIFSNLCHLAPGPASRSTARRALPSTALALVTVFTCFLNDPVTLPNSELLSSPCRPWTELQVSLISPPPADRRSKTSTKQEVFFPSFHPFRRVPALTFPYYSIPCFCVFRSCSSLMKPLSSDFSLLSRFSFLSCSPTVPTAGAYTRHILGLRRGRFLLPSNSFCTDTIVP